MPNPPSTNVRSIFFSVMIAAAMVVSLPAVGGPPTLSSNPGEHAIFPSNGQDEAQQENDQQDAYDWATKKTGWDPYEAMSAFAAKDAASQQAKDATKGSAVKSTVRGGILGLAVGAIADDAGKGAAIGAAVGGLTGGMKSRQARQGLDQQVATAEKEFKAKFQEWDRYFVAAMEGKGYTVK